MEERQLETLFGGVVDWIVGDGAERGVAEGLGPLRVRTEIAGLDGGRHGSLREIMLLLSMMEITGLMRRDGTDEDMKRVGGEFSLARTIGGGDD